MSGLVPKGMSIRLEKTLSVVQTLGYLLITKNYDKVEPTRAILRNDLGIP